MLEESEQVPGDRHGSREVTLGGGECVGGGSTLEEEECEEDENFAPDARCVGSCVYAKGLEGGEDDEDGSPSVVERERKVNEDFIQSALGKIVFLDDVVDVGDGGTDKEGKNEGNNVMVGCPQVDVNGVEDTEKRETPRNAVDDDLFTGGGELVDDRSEQQQMDQ